MLIAITIISIVSYFAKVIFVGDKFELNKIDILIILCSIPIAFFLWKIDEKKLNKKFQNAIEELEFSEKKDLLGKSINVEIKFLDKSEKQIENYKTSGIISEINNQGIIKISRNNKPDFGLPYHEISLIKTESNTKLKEKTFCTIWEVIVTNKDGIADCKLNGFTKTT
jgi:hypothetical protein